jgi:hypothetical protein
MSTLTFPVLGLIALVAPIAGCGGSSAGAVDDSTPRTPLPAAIAGDWTASHGGTTQDCDPYGNCSYGDSTIEHLQLIADGTFDDETLIQQSAYGCQTKFLGHSVGTVVVNEQAGSLVLYLQHTGVTSQDSCHAENNYERDSVSHDTWSYSFETGTDPNTGHPALLLTAANGAADVFHPSSDFQQ